MIFAAVAIVAVIVAAVYLVSRNAPPAPPVAESVVAGNENGVRTTVEAE